MAHYYKLGGTFGQLNVLKVLLNLVLLVNRLPNTTFVVITVIVLSIMDLWKQIVKTAVTKELVGFSLQIQAILAALL